MIRTALWFAFCASAALAQPLDLRPFEMVWRADSGVLADMSFLLDAPAGKNGFLCVQNGHLATPDGRRTRLWGVNLSMSGSRPSKEDAPAYAAHLARFGVNCVRIHHLDWRTPRGIIDSRQPDSRSRRRRDGPPRFLHRRTQEARHLREPYARLLLGHRNPYTRTEYRNIRSQPTTHNSQPLTPPA